MMCYYLNVQFQGQRVKRYVFCLHPTARLNDTSLYVLLTCNTGLVSGHKQPIQRDLATKFTKVIALKKFWTSPMAYGY